MIELKSYTLNELKTTLNISKRQWDERKSELLEYFKLFFDYEIQMQGRSYIFNIKEQFMEYEPIPRKDKTKDIKEYYIFTTDAILSEKPRNTGANVAREITATNNKYNHATGTVENYIRPHIKENYFINDKQWCGIDYNTCTY